MQARSAPARPAYDPFVAIGERAGMSELRRQLVSTAEGRVPEPGAGTGLRHERQPRVRRKLDAQTTSTSQAI
ncbi:MAG TPA: hypothetical protein VLJ42_00100 [Solirubrobacteraceae bacterium]|nr:hypothetical protein [Solirubrobacteraceae bacterium]